MTDYLKHKIKSFDPSSKLYAKPSFIDGMSSIFNIYGNNFDFKYSESSKIADSKAIKRDWEIIGNDLNTCINSHDNI